MSSLASRNLCSLIAESTTTLGESSPRASVISPRGRLCAEVGDPPAVLPEGEPEAQQAELVSLAGRTREHGARADAVPPAPSQRA